jgi:hypothetical protein
MFEEPIVVHASKEDSDGVRRDGTVRGTVIVGAGQNQSAGSTGYAETADRVSAVIRRGEWFSAFTFAPRFGMKLGLAKFGKVTVKAVQESENEFTLRCARNMRAKER